MITGNKCHSKAVHIADARAPIPAPMAVPIGPPTNPPNAAPAAITVVARQRSLARTAFA